MKYNITQYDKDLFSQASIDYKLRLLVEDSNKNVLDELSGIRSIGSYSIDSESNIRRTDIVNIGLHFFLKNVRPYAASCSEA